jgi:hypothetical protein
MYMGIVSLKPRTNYAKQRKLRNERLVELMSIRFIGLVSRGIDRMCVSETQTKF